MSTKAEGSPGAAQKVLHTNNNQSDNGSTGLRGILSFLTGASRGETDGDGMPGEEDPDPSGTSAWSPGATHYGAEVRDVMVPRAGIVAVPVTSTLDELVDVYKRSGRTRIPVYSGSLDDTLGFLHLKDIALEYGFNGTGSSFDINDKLWEPLYVPPSMEISSLREKMQETGCHLALVIDEYGGVDGLVTIEDLLEHHFGAIVDEHDTPSSVSDMIRELSPGSYECSGRTSLEEIERLYGRHLFTEDLDDDIDTIGGWISAAVNRIPVNGETILIDNDRITIKIINADARKVNLLQVSQQG